MALTIPNQQGISGYFTRPDKAPKSVPRLAISLDGQDKCGKTHWALRTSPQPIAHIICNDNTATYEKAVRDGYKIHMMELSYPEPSPSVISKADVDKRDWEAWIKEWHRFKAAVEAVKRDKSIRTLVWDTASEIWHLAELAHFGKLRGNARIDVRTELNSDFTGVYWKLYKERPDLNIILIHKTKKQYAPVLDAGGKPMRDSKGDVKNEWNGKYEREGYNQIGYNVDLTLQCGWDGSKRSFYTTIDPSQATRYGTEQVGKKWYGMDSGFANLALEIFPETEDIADTWWGL